MSKRKVVDQEEVYPSKIVKCEPIPLGGHYGIEKLILSFLPKELYAPYRLVCRRWNYILRPKMLGHYKSVYAFTEYLYGCHQAVTYCTENGYFSLLKWLRAQGCSLITARLNAVTYGQLEILEWLHTNGLVEGVEICQIAAKHGHLEILKWARKNGYPWNEQICTHAALNGHIETFQWARENGCPWDEQKCTFAAKYRYSEILKWARENECPWDEETCIKEGYSKILKWAQDCGCPHGEKTSMDLKDRIYFFYT